MNTTNTSYPYWHATMQPAQYIPTPTPSLVPGQAQAQGSTQPTHQQTYMERLIRVKNEQEQQQAYNVTINNNNNNHTQANVNTLAAVAQTHLPSTSMSLYNNNNAKTSYSFATPSTCASTIPPVPVTVKIEPASELNNNNNTNANTSIPPVSRFQQLLSLKLAAEKSVSASNQQMQPSHAEASHAMVQAFARMQNETTDTVFHKDFARRHYDTNTISQASQQEVKSDVHFKQPSFPPPSYPPPPKNPQPMYKSSSSDVSYDPQPVFDRYNPLPTLSQHVNANYGNQQNYNNASLVTNHILNIFTPQMNMYAPGPTTQSDTWASSSAPSVRYNVPSNSSNPGPPPSFVGPNTMDAKYMSSPAPTHQAQEQSPWVVGPKPFPEAAPWSNQSQHQRVGPYNPAVFSWSVSEVRTPVQEPVYLPRQAQQTPSLAQSDSSSVSSGPITPKRNEPYCQTDYAAMAYTRIKQEPQTSPIHLAASYARPTPGSPSMPTCAPASPLLSYGIAMFANMNGAVQIPGGSAIYSASTDGNGNGGDMPQTLADGLAGGSGGEGSSGGSNGGDGWANGSNGGGGSGGEGSGSGSGQGGGDGNGGGGGGDGNGSTPKRKLQLACHFCRRRKLKCNGEKPRCDNCTKRNEECTWDDNVRRRGPGRATKERRDKAAQEAIAAGLINAESIGGLHMALPHLQELAPAPGHGDVGQNENGNGNGNVTVSEEEAVALLNIPDENGNTISLHPDLLQQHQHQNPEGEGVGGGEEEYDPNIPIDPALAALSAAIPGTLAEFEVDVDTKLDDININQVQGQEQGQNDLVGMGIKRKSIGEEFDFGEHTNGNGNGNEEKKLKLDDSLVQ